MKTLHLTLKKQWYDMILSGEKIEEYREIKPYWITRLQRVNGMRFPDNGCIMADAVKFTNGYGKNRPSFTVECLGITIGCGMMSWGAPKDKEVFIIKLGRKIITDLDGNPIGYVEN